MLYEVSQYVLVVVVCLEMFVLRSVLEEVAELQRGNASGDSSRCKGTHHGFRMPAFRAPVLATNEVVTHRDLRGKESILVFLSDADFQHWSGRAMASMIGGLWERTDGTLHIVCLGNRTVWSDYFDQLDILHHENSTLKILLDEQSTLVSKFNVQTTPYALMFDARGHVKKSGAPIDEQGSDATAGPESKSVNSLQGAGAL